MSRTKRQQFENKYPDQPVKAWGYIDSENSVIKVNGLGEDIDPEGKGLTLPFGINAEGNEPILVTLEATFFKYFFNNQTKFKARSTEYRSRANDRIAIFENGSKSMSTTAENAPTYEDGKQMSTGMKIYLYNPGNDIAFRLELTALQRSAFMDFRKEYAKDNEADEYPVFYLFDMVPPTEEQRDKGAAKHWRYPVFNSATTDHGSLERADAICESIDKYFDQHPDFWNPEDEAEEVETKAVPDNSKREEEDAELEKHLSDLPTHDGEENPIDDIDTEGIFEDSEIPPVKK